MPAARADGSSDEYGRTHFGGVIDAVECIAEACDADYVDLIKQFYVSLPRELVMQPSLIEPFQANISAGKQRASRLDRSRLRQSVHRQSVLSWLGYVFLFIVCVASTSGFAVADQPSAADSGDHGASGSRPNLIFILVDDLGWGDLGCFFQNKSDHVRTHQTPNLDQMAAEGLQMRTHYCPAPVCAPSRGSLLTGTHQGHCSIRDNQFDKALPEVPTLGSVLQQAGYRTTLVGKYGLQGKRGSDAESWPAYPTKRGFDEYFGYVRHVDGHLHYPAHHWPIGNGPVHRSPKEVWHNDEEISDQLDLCYTTDLFTAKAKQTIVDHVSDRPEQPFFVMLTYDTPHAALQVPTVKYPEGSGVNGGLQWIGEPGRMINTAEGEIDSYRHEDYVGRGWSDVEERFATMVRRIDNCIGDLLQTLRDLDVADNTVVIFSSDNGPHRESYLQNAEYAPTSFQSYGPWDGIKRDCFEGGIRMPTLAWGPGYIPGGRIDENPSQFHDWLTTFADFAGVAPPARADGVSLRPVLSGQGEPENGTIYIEYFNNRSTPAYEDFLSSRRGQRRGQMQVVHVDGYKGVRTNVRAADDPFAIYDLQNDLGETQNLAGTNDEFRALQERMQRRVTRLRRVNSEAGRPYDELPIASLDESEIEQQVGQSHLRLEQIEPSSAAAKTNYLPDGPWQAAPLKDSAKGSVVSDDKSGEHKDKRLAEKHVLSALGDTEGILRLRGVIEVPETGFYRLAVHADGPALLRLHQAAVIDTTGGVTDSQVAVKLEAGLHPFILIADTQQSPTERLWTIAAPNGESRSFSAYLPSGAANR